MSTRSEAYLVGEASPKGWQVPEFIVLAAFIWNLVILAGSLLATIYIISLDNFFDLGRAVQYFAAVVVLIPGIISIYSALGLSLKLLPDQLKMIGNMPWTPSPRAGRMASVGLNYVGAVLGFAYLLHLWNFFLGMDSMAAAFHENRNWLLAIIVAYLIYWLAGRFHEDSQTRLNIERAGLALGMASLVGLLWFSGLLDALSDVLGTYGETRTWLVTGAVMIFASVFYGMLRLARYFGETPEERTAWQGWLMLSPNIIGFMLFFAGPLLLSLYISFTNSPPGSSPTFTGLENYTEILNVQVKTQDDLGISAQKALDFGFSELTSFEVGGTRYVIGAKDRLFWISLKNTLLFSIFLVPLSVIPALAIAILLNSKLPGVKFFRSMYFLPSVAAVVGVGVIWREAMYGSTVGYINFFVTEIVGFLNDTLGLGITDPKVVWLSEAQLAAMVIMAAWQIVGFNTVLYLAGLQGIPNVLYEASEVDGANRWQQFRHVTFPLLGPTTFFVIVTTMINGLQVFNEPYVLFRDPPPEGGITGVFYLYRRTFFGSNFGYSSAIAWLLFIVIFIITIIQFRIQRSDPYGNA